jgi:hypothetical protein
MNKAILGCLYMLSHPARTVKIFNLYKHLHGRYKITIILSHTYIESFYKLKKQVKIAKQYNKTNKQVIVIKYGGLVHSGGLTDRLKGICTLYMLSQKYQLDFKILFIHPFDLTKYLLPNEYDWIIREEEIIYDLKTTAIYTYEDEENAKTFIKQNADKKQLHIGCNSKECFNDFHKLFNELFKPSPFLLMQLAPHREHLGEKYISISFRFQNLLGEFVEANSKPIDRVQQKKLIDKCLLAIDEIRKRHSDIPQILITSDSNVFREIATYTYTYTLPNEVGHIDYAESNKCKELTAFLDIFLIAGAKKAFQVRTNEMYNSDFPVFAAKMNNVPYEMVLI